MGGASRMSYVWRLECEDCNELCFVENDYSKDEPEACPYCSSFNVIVELEEDSDEEFDDEDE